MAKYFNVFYMFIEQNAYTYEHPLEKAAREKAESAQAGDDDNDGDE